MSLAHARGLAMVVENDRVTGVITAGDLTRLAERWNNFLDLPAGDVMTRHAADGGAGRPGVGGAGHHGAARIVAMPVVDENQRMVGVVHLHDLMRAGAV